MRFKLGLVLISLLPIWPLRRRFYNAFYKYEIDKNSRIGMFNYINCNSLRMKQATIGSFNFIVVRTLDLGLKSNIYSRNRIKNLNCLTIGESGIIYKSNFIGGPNNGNKPFIFEMQNLLLGNSSDILRNNYFDIVRPIIIGNNVVFGGEGSEIWTHGFETNRTMLTGEVSFGNNIFIGSGCVFTKSVHVCDNVTIGPSSVIYKSINEPGFYTTHQIIKVK
jgi:UDP-3-O-[3-hydroxymyristoyl] glucosamine N-acyltransferase